MKKLFLVLVLAAGSVSAARVHYLQDTKYDGTVDVGVEGSSTGTIQLRNGVNNNSVYIKSGVVTSTYTLTLPSADGTSGQVLQTDGSGNLSFGTTVSTITANTGDEITIHKDANNKFSAIGSSVTLQGNSFNGNNELLKLNGTGVVPDSNIDGTITRDSEWDTIDKIETATSANIIVSSENAHVGTVTATGDISVNQTKKVILDRDNGNDSYITKDASGVRFYMDGVEYMRFE